MATYMTWLRDQAIAAEKETRLSKALSGVDSDFATHRFAWGDSAWQQVKSDADEAGLIIKARNKTGFGAAMDAATKQAGKAPDGSNPEALAKHNAKMVELLDQVIQIAQGLKAKTGNKNFQAYFDDAIRAAEGRKPQG